MSSFTSLRTMICEAGWKPLFTYWITTAQMDVLLTFWIVFWHFQWKSERSFPMEIRLFAKQTAVWEVVLSCFLPTRKEDCEHLICIRWPWSSNTCPYCPAEQGLSHLPSGEMWEGQLYILSRFQLESLLISTNFQGIFSLQWSSYVLNYSHKTKGLRFFSDFFVWKVN